MPVSLKINRAAPRPLSVYLGAAMTLPTATPADVERMVRGIKKYQTHDFVRPAMNLETIWGEDTSTLMVCPAKEKAKGAVLLIPSMINGCEILDLLPDQSFTRWLAGQGLDVYLLDWGRPADDAGLQTLDAALARLARLATFVRQQTGKPADTIGYCMGGTLLLGAAARQPDLFGRLVLLSAPWDFHAGDQRMTMQVAAGTPMALQLLEAKASLPVDWIQNIFARVNPVLALYKFSNFFDMAANSSDEQTFVAVEDWLNGGQNMASGVARACILDWYGKNLPGQGQWIDLTSLKDHSVLIVAAQKDILVPPEAAIAASQHLPFSTVINPSCGHISLMAGRNAVDTVWQPVCDWLTGLA